MNKEIALKYLKEYDSIFHKFVKFYHDWYELNGNMETIDFIPRVEDMFMSILEGELELEEGTLWDYFVTKNRWSKYFVKVGEEDVEIRDVEHLVSALESKKEKGESQ